MQSRFPGSARTHGLFVYQVPLVLWPIAVVFKAFGIQCEPVRGHHALHLELEGATFVFHWIGDDVLDRRGACTTPHDEKERPPACTRVEREATAR